jgi:hypothetical protein
MLWRTWLGIISYTVHTCPPTPLCSPALHRTCPRLPGVFLESNPHSLFHRQGTTAVPDPLELPWIYVLTQDVPESVTVSSPEVSDEAASVEVQTSLGNRFTVRLLQKQNIWKISEVVCE